LGLTTPDRVIENFDPLCTRVALNEVDDLRIKTMLDLRVIVERLK
jgi:hypothetical protein